MSLLLKLIRFEHDFEHDLKKNKKFGGPYIYDAGGDLSARWYVYYSFRNPETNKLERQPNIYLDINDYDTIRDRKKAAKLVQESLKDILINGNFNPFEQEKVIEESIAEPKEVRLLNSEKDAEDAIDYALEIAKSMYAETTYRDFKSRVTQYKKWLIENKFGNKAISSIVAEQPIHFLNAVLKRSSATNRNNTRAALLGLYVILIENKFVPENIISGIKVLSSRPERNKSFSTTQEEEILEAVRKYKPMLDLYIKFISVNLLRPIEVCRLKIKDIDLTDRILNLRAKNKAVKRKIIPELIMQDLPDLSLYNSEDYLFTPTGPGNWDAKETSRSDHFSKEFKEIKDKLGLGKDYGLYSFRHTYITKLYNKIRESYTPFEAKSRLMLITGHATIDALEKYLRDVDAELPEDY